MAGPFDFLHIKGRTAGSSNELSFDVLDAASRDADAKKKSSSRAATAPKPSQGTYHGVAGTSTLSAIPEVERRKKARRTRSIRMGALAVLVVVALVAAGVYTGVRLYQSRIDFSTRFALLIDRFVEIDQSLVTVDALMSDPLDSAEASRRAEIAKRIPDLESALSEIADGAASMEPDARTDQDLAALGQVAAAAEARHEMLGFADDAFALAQAANRQSADASEAWNKVLAGDGLAREASSLANAASTEEVTVQARAKTEEAAAAMQAGRDKLAALEKERKGIDFSAELAYIDKRLESLASAVDTSDALLANDRLAASAANDAYNAADAAAAEMAAALDTYVGDRVKSAYADDLSRIQSEYAARRAETTTADSALRAYLS